jgi:hypothetical protein
MRTNSTDNTRSIAIAFLLCGGVLLAFPKYVGMSGIIAGICYGAGLIVLLVGILGFWVEQGKKEEHDAR